MAICRNSGPRAGHTPARTAPELGRKGPWLGAGEGAGGPSRGRPRGGQVFTGNRDGSAPGMLAWWVLNQGEYTPYPVGTSPSPPSPDPFILISTSMDTLPAPEARNIWMSGLGRPRAGGGMFRPGMGGGPGRGGGQVAPLSEDIHSIWGRPPGNSTVFITNYGQTGTGAGRGGPASVPPSTGIPPGRGGPEHPGVPVAPDGPDQREIHGHSPGLPGGPVPGCTPG